jgi:uncharacterized Tic20 family protein
MVQQTPMQPPATPTISQDDRVFAGCCHIAMFFGFPVVGPLVVYAIKKDTSRFVAFHALQATITHLSVIPLMMLGYVFGFAFTLGMDAALDPRSMFLPFGMIGIWGLGFCMPWLVVTAISIYAAYRAFSGDSYRIPIVGRVVDRIMAPTVAAPQRPF